MQSETERAWGALNVLSISCSRSIVWSERSRNRRDPKQIKQVCCFYKARDVRTGTKFFIVIFFKALHRLSQKNRFMETMNWIVVQKGLQFARCHIVPDASFLFYFHPFLCNCFHSSHHPLLYYVCNSLPPTLKCPNMPAWMRILVKQKNKKKQKSKQKKMDVYNNIMLKCTMACAIVHLPLSKQAVSWVVCKLSPL